MDTILVYLGALVQAADQCLDDRRPMPALTLIYAAIDIVASLERSETEGTRQAFVRWIDRYMVPIDRLKCTASELYGARCAILHTGTAESDLSRAGKVKRIYYAWGTARTEPLEQLIERVGRREVVVVHINNLRNIFCKAILDWSAAVKQQPQLLLTMESASNSWFEVVPTGAVDSFLRRSR